MNHEELRGIIPDIREYPNFSLRDNKIYGHINSNYLVWVHDNKNIKSKDDAIKYLKEMNLPGEELSPICLNDCTIMLVNRKVFEKAMQNLLEETVVDL